MLNIMAGTARSLETAPLSGEDMSLYNRDFDVLVNDILALVDHELGQDLISQKDWYGQVAAVAKGYFNNKPFGGLKAATGQFGMRLIAPQDLRTTATSETAAYYSWLQTLTTTSAKSYRTYGIGGSSTAQAYAQNVSEKKEVIAFHRLISYRPDPNLIAVGFQVNDLAYAPYTVETFSKISKGANKLFRILPMPGGVLLHPGGHFSIDFYFDLGTGTTAPSGTSQVTVEIAPWGLLFAEYDFLASSNWT